VLQGYGINKKDELLFHPASMHHFHTHVLRQIFVPQLIYLGSTLKQSRDHNKSDSNSVSERMYQSRQRRGNVDDFPQYSISSFLFSCEYIYP
jgi:hypothetical protein